MIFHRAELYFDDEDEKEEKLMREIELRMGPYISYEEWEKSKVMPGWEMIGPDDGKW